jgi:hypothetical protein
LKLLRSSPVNSANTLRRLGVIDRLDGALGKPLEPSEKIQCSKPLQ